MSPTCDDCIYSTDNPHYAECGDMDNGYCKLFNKTIDLQNEICGKAELELLDEER